MEQGQIVQREEAEAPEVQQPPQQEQGTYGAEAPVGTMVMEIDMQGDAATIARETIEAQLRNIPIVRMNEKQADDKTPAEQAPDEGEPHKQAPGEVASAPATPEETEHPLRKFLMGDSEETKPAKPITITAPVKEFFERHGLGDAATVIASLPKVTAENGDLRAKLAEATKNIEAIAKLSPEAQSVLQKDLEGKDWQSEVAARPRFDWSKKASEQDPQALAKAYGDDSITDDDWEEFKDPDGDKRTKAYVQAKLDLWSVSYDKQATEATGYAGQQAAAHASDLKKYNDSLDTSMAGLYRDIPGSEVYGEKIKKVLTPQGVLGMFFEDDGVTVRPEAPMTAWLAIDRAAVLGAKMKRVQRDAKDQATKDLLNRTPDRRAARAAPSKGNAGEQKVDARQYVKQRLGW